MAHRASPAALFDMQRADAGEFFLHGLADFQRVVAPAAVDDRQKLIVQMKRLQRRQIFLKDTLNVIGLVVDRQDHRYQLDFHQRTSPTAPASRRASSACRAIPARSSPYLRQRSAWLPLVPSGASAMPIIRKRQDNPRDAITVATNAPRPPESVCASTETTQRNGASTRARCASGSGWKFETTTTAASTPCAESNSAAAAASWLTDPIATSATSPPFRITCTLPISKRSPSPGTVVLSSLPKL